MDFIGSVEFWENYKDTAVIKNKRVWVAVAFKLYYLLNILMYETVKYEMVPYDAA